MSELYGDQLNENVSLGLGDRVSSVQNRLTDWRLQLGLGAADSLVNLRNSIQTPTVRNASKSTTQVANNVRSFQRMSLPIKDVREFNSEIIKIQKNTTLLDRLFLRFSKDGLKNINGLDDKGLKPLNATIKTTGLNINNVFKESDSWIGKIRKGLGGLENSFEKLAAFTFGVSSLKILTDSFISLRNEVERVNSSLKILNKTGFNPEMIETVNKFEDALLNFDTSNVEEFATSFVSQYKSVTSQLAQIGTLTQEEIRKSTEKGEDFLGDYFEKVQRMVETSLKSTVTSSDALDATYTALQAGLQEKGGMATVDTAVENSLKLVATQGGDASAVMELLVQTMTAFNLSASSTGDILGKLNKLVDVGITSIPELQQGFGQLGVSASSAGVTLDEMSGTLAQLTLSGSNTFMAMTGLNNLFNKIRSGSVTDRLAEIGATLDGQAVRFDSSSVAADGFAKSIDSVNRALGGSKELWQQVLGGDQEATRAVFGALKKDIDGLDKLIQEIGKAGVKNLEDAFNIKINNDQVLQFEQILNRVSEVALKLGKILTPLFSKGIDRIEKNIDRIGYLVENYGELIFKLVELNLQMRTVNAAFGILISTIFKLLGAYALYFFASGKLQKNIGLVWNALTKKNEAIAKGNILWDKQTNLLTKVGAVIGQLLGVYDLERKGKEQITKAEQKNIDKTLEGRAITAAAHKEKLEQLRAEKAEYERLEKVKNNALGTSKLQRVFQERDEQKAQLKEVEVRQNVFETEAKGREAIQTELRELESKQVRTELEEKKVELLRNVQQRDNNILQLEKEVSDLQDLKKQGVGGLVADKALAEREADLRRLKDEREFDNYELGKRREIAETAIKSGDKADKFTRRMDNVDSSTGITRREKLTKQREELVNKETTNKQEEKRKQQQLGRINALLNADRDIRDSRNVETLNTKDVQVKRYTTEKTLEYIDKNQDKKSFQRAVERERRAGQANSAGNFGQDLASNLITASGSIGNKTVSGAVNTAGQVLYGISGAAFLADSTMSLKKSFAKTGDSIADGSAVAAKTLDGTFKLVTKGVGGFVNILMKLITPTNVLVAALAALGATIGKLTFDSEQKKNQAEKLLKDTEVTPSEKPKSVLDRAKENLSISAGAISSFFGGNTKKVIDKNLGFAGGTLNAVAGLFGLNKENVEKLINQPILKKEVINPTSNFFDEKILNPFKNYFNFEERLNAPVVQARSDVMSNINEQYAKNLSTGISQTTKNIQQRTFDDVIIGKNKQSFDYTKTIGDIFGKKDITNKDVELADAVKRKTVENLQTKLNSQNESLQIVGKNVSGLFAEAITNTGLNKDDQTKLDEISRKIIDEKARLKERLDKKEITQQDYDKQLIALNDRTSDIFSGSDQRFLKETYSKLSDSAKMTLETAMNENVLLKERTRLYEQEKRVFDSFQEAANATQSFIKNLADVGDSNTPEAKSAELGLESKIKNLGEEVGNFAKVTTAKERGKDVKPEDDARSGKIFENLQNNLPGIIEGIVGNAQSGFSDDTNKAQRLRDVIKTQVTDKFAEQGFSPEDAQRKTNALLKQYGIQQQIRQLEDDDFQKRMDRIEKERQVFDVMKQSEFLITKDVIEKTQQLELKALEETITFQQKRVEDLRTKVKTKDKKDGYDPQILKDAENELKVTEEKLIIQRINQKRELLDYESKVVTDIYTKRYAEIEELVLRGEKTVTTDERIKFESEKQQKILELNVQTQMKLREILTREGKLTAETQIRIEKDIQEARVNLLRSYIEEAKQRYDNLAQNIQKIGDAESNYLSAAINKLGVKTEIYDKINQLISQQKSLFDSAQSNLERDASFIRNNLVSRRKQIEFEKLYYAQRKKALAEQLAFERQSLEVQKQQNELLVKRLKIEQDIKEKTAKLELTKAIIKEEAVMQDGSSSEADKLTAQTDRKIAEMNVEAAYINRDNIAAQEALMRNEVSLKEYELNQKTRQGFQDIERDYAGYTRTKTDDARLTKQALFDFQNGNYPRIPELSIPTIDTTKREQEAKFEIEKVKTSIKDETKGIRDDLTMKIKAVDTNLKKPVEDILKVGQTQSDTQTKITLDLKTLIEHNKTIIDKHGESIKVQSKVYDSQEKNIKAQESQHKNTVEMSGKILSTLEKILNKPDKNQKPNTEDLQVNLQPKRTGGIESIIENTMREMLEMSGMKLEDIPEYKLPKVRFAKEQRPGWGGDYNFGTNELRISEKYKDEVANLDESGMRILVHELRHWMQDEGLNKGWLTTQNIKDPEKRKWAEESGVPFSGNNKWERDAYGFDGEYTDDIIREIIGNASVISNSNTKENVSSIIENELVKQTKLQETIIKYVEKLYAGENVKSSVDQNDKQNKNKAEQKDETVDVVSVDDKGKQVGKTQKIKVISKERANEIKAQKDLGEKVRRDNNTYYQTLAELGGVVDVSPNAKPENQIKQLKTFVDQQVKQAYKMHTQGKLGAEQTQQFVKDWRTNEKEYAQILQRGVLNPNQEVEKLKKQQEEQRSKREKQVEKASGVKNVQQPFASVQKQIDGAKANITKSEQNAENIKFDKSQMLPFQQQSRYVGKPQLIGGGWSTDGKGGYITPTGNSVRVYTPQVSQKTISQLANNPLNAKFVQGLKRIEAIPKPKQPEQKPDYSWTKEQYYAYIKEIQQRPENKYKMLNFKNPEALGITKSEKDGEPNPFIMHNRTPSFKYEGQQGQILAGLSANTNNTNKLNNSQSTNNNTTNQNKNVNVTLSPKIEIKIEKDTDENLAKNTAEEINKQLFSIFNEVAYNL